MDGNDYANRPTDEFDKQPPRKVCSLSKQVQQILIVQTFFQVRMNFVFVRKIRCQHVQKQRFQVHRIMKTNFTVFPRRSWLYATMSLSFVNVVVMERSEVFTVVTG